ncbi:APC family permease [Gordonia sp. CPCC 205333]|uniref:APC family permease n=1 Tax=Gordonia sp. CPCC 205333 TaxID=3140790 RepID=UPI003AF33418
MTSTITPPDADVADPTPSRELHRDGLGPWEVFAQGLAAAAPSVAIAGVPISLYTATGKGAVWAGIIGLVIVVLIAITISYQAKRTVTSGSLGTYTGNGLGPGAAFAAGLSLLIGYIGFATVGALGGVLYFESFLSSIGIHAESTAFKLVIAVIVVLVASYLPFRGASLAAKYELAFEIAAIACIAVIIGASYTTYGLHFDAEQFSLSHLGQNSTFVAAVTAVGAYAGFESVASLGGEARDAHRSISRSLLRVVLVIGVLYLIATYPQVLNIGGVDPDEAVLPQLADRTDVVWINPIVSLTLTVAFLVFVTAVTNSAARTLLTLSREGALPKVLAKVHPVHRTPWVGIAFVGVLALAFAVAATLSTTGRLLFDVYGIYVANWGFLVSYLLVVAATPIWLYRIKALTVGRAIVSGTAFVAVGYVIVGNIYPSPKWPYNILPFVFLGLLAAGLLWYLFLRLRRPEVARRIGTIQTLSPQEQERLAELGIAAGASAAHRS